MNLMNTKTKIRPYASTTDGQQKEPRPMRSLVYFEQAARSLFDRSQFLKYWRIISDDLDGCRLQIVQGEGETETQQPARWIIWGMPPEKAGLYNDTYAKSFENALIGVLGKRVDLHFDTSGKFSNGGTEPDG